MPGQICSTRQEGKTPPGQHRIPVTVEDVQHMNGTPATAPQKHGGSTFSGPSLTKFLLQSEIQLDPLHPFSKQPGAGPLPWRITILCIVMFHCGPTTERP